MDIPDRLVAAYTLCTGVEPSPVVDEMLQTLAKFLGDHTLTNIAAGHELKLLAAVLQRAATNITGDPLTQDQSDVIRLRRELQNAQQERDEALGYVTHIKEFVDDVFDRSLKD